jgi:hypothetical protein
MSGALRCQTSSGVGNPGVDRVGGHGHNDRQRPRAAVSGSDSDPFPGR